MESEDISTGLHVDFSSVENSSVSASTLHEYDVIQTPPSSPKNPLHDYQPDIRNRRLSSHNSRQLSFGGSNEDITVHDSVGYDDADNGSNRRNVSEISCPRVNCIEKLVICLDLSAELEKPTFRSRSGDKFSTLKLLKRALGLFLHSKHRIDKRHEYALVVLQDTATWVSDFTNEPKVILNLLEDLFETFICETFDLSSLFQTILDKAKLPHVDGDPKVLPPPYVVRVLLFYGRSEGKLEFRKKEAHRLLNASPYFFIDALYIHEPPSDDNKCEEIFDRLCDLDEKGFSYIFEVSRNLTKLYDYTAQLLPHPLQRPLQKDAAFRIKPRSLDEG